MQPITDQTIDLINDRIQHMDEGQIGRIWDSFAREQPALVGYVLGESRELAEPDAREDVAYVLTVILLSFREFRPGIPAISEQEFEKSFNEEFDEMENVFQEGFDESDAMAVIESFCRHTVTSSTPGPLTVTSGSSFVAHSTALRSSLP